MFRKFKNFLQIIHCLIIISCCFLPEQAFPQYSPTDIKYSVINFYALRYYPFTVEADSIIKQVIKKYAYSLPPSHQKTAIQIVANKQFLDAQTGNLGDDLFYKNIVNPKSWIKYAAPLKSDGKEFALTIGLNDEYRTDSTLWRSKNEGLYDFLGKQSVAYLIDEIIGQVDLFKNENDVILSPFKSPLTEKNRNIYKYFLSGTKIMDNQPVYEIVFYPKNIRANAFTGYLYVSADENYLLTKAVFTPNNFYSATFARNILFEQTFFTNDSTIFPLKKETFFTLGDEVKGNLLVNRTIDYTDITTPLSASEEQVNQVVEFASKHRPFRLLQNGIHFLLTDHITIGGKKGIFEWGPVLESVSYNKMEGLRLKIAANTTLNFHKHWLLGGFLAYGSRDEILKYGGNIVYSFLPKDKDIWEFPKRLLSVTYVQDLNIPGQDLLTGNRDNIFYSFSHTATYEMSLQKLAAIHYEHEFSNRLSFKIGGKYLYDRPMGAVQYLNAVNNSIVNHLKITELDFSFCYAPGEIFFQNRENRLYVRGGKIELNFLYRIGLKKILNSDYNYHITNLSIYKRFYFPQNRGSLDASLSAGKVWSRVPFPLLFIPKGNHSYVFDSNKYNLMNYYEFVTDRFVAGNVNFLFNWSPFRWLFASKIKTSMGARAIYGPLSDNNDPALHPELYQFNQGIQPLGNRPYVEINIGFANILKIFRVEWVQRLTYLNESYKENKTKKGAFFITGSFSF
jgi:hypothetical protein